MQPCASCTGLWHWAPHPEWKGDKEWLKVVSSYAIDDGDRLLLFRPARREGDPEPVDGHVFRPGTG